MDTSPFMRTLAHPTLRSATTGTLILGVCFAALPFLDPKGARLLPMLLAAAACFIVVLLPVYPTYRLVTGRLSLSAYARRFFWTTVFPWALVIGHFGAYVPTYLPLFFILFVGGGGIGVGILPRWSYLANTGWMVVWFVASLVWVQPGIFASLPPSIPLSLGLVVVGALWIGQVSNYYVSRNETAGQLLRSSRRDKRLIAEERRKSDRLLLNILPASIAEELKAHGSIRPILFPEATVLFTDFEGFTLIAATMQPQELVRELDQCFSYFDSVVERYNLEKLKTIGDSYMCAGGVPIRNATHAVDCTLAALEIQSFMNRMKEVKAAQNLPYWELRLGIHTGPLVAGVIGEKKFAYDVWGDTVNTASRCESSGQTGQINVSRAVYERIQPFFGCVHRGKVPAKHKGEIDMYFVEGIRAELSRDGDGRVPNEAFQERYDALA